MFLSGGLLSPAARKFALHWGIMVVEPHRMPLLVLHWLAGQSFPTKFRIDVANQDRIWDEVPAFIVPLQQRIRLLCSLLERGGDLVAELRNRRMLDSCQREDGDGYWTALDELAPEWLENRYDELGVEASTV
jgi:hypothetical protein